MATWQEPLLHSHKTERKVSRKGRCASGGEGGETFSLSKMWCNADPRFFPCCGRSRGMRVKRYERGGIAIDAESQPLCNTSMYVHEVTGAVKTTTWNEGEKKKMQPHLGRRWNGWWVVSLHLTASCCRFRRRLRSAVTQEDVRWKYCDQTWSAVSLGARPFSLDSDFSSGLSHQIMDVEQNIFSAKLTPLWVPAT